MKTSLVALVAALLATTSAHAVVYDETCTLKNNDAVHVHYADGAWSIRHTLENGHVYYRDAQYAIADQTTYSAGLYYPKWQGALRRSPALVMVGALGLSGGTPMYWETLYKDGVVNMQDEGVCTFDNGWKPAATPVAAPIAAPVAPPVTAPVATPVASTSGVAVVGLSSLEAGNKAVEVLIGNTPTRLELDTGASHVFLPEGFANALIASGEAVEIAAGSGVLADGSTIQNRRINILHLTIGGRTIDNVMAGVGPANGSFLLGFDVLSRFGKFSVDAINNVLTLG